MEGRWTLGVQVGRPPAGLCSEAPGAEGRRAGGGQMPRAQPDAADQEENVMGTHEEHFQAGTSQAQARDHCVLT